MRLATTWMDGQTTSTTRIHFNGNWDLPERFIDYGNGFNWNTASTQVKNPIVHQVHCCCCCLCIGRVTESVCVCRGVQLVAGSSSGWPVTLTGSHVLVVLPSPNLCSLAKANNNNLLCKKRRRCDMFGQVGTSLHLLCSARSVSHPIHKHTLVLCLQNHPAGRVYSRMFLHEKSAFPVANRFEILITCN